MIFDTTQALHNQSKLSSRVILISSAPAINQAKTEQNASFIHEMHIKQAPLENFIRKQEAALDASVIKHKSRDSSIKKLTKKPELAGKQEQETREAPLEKIHSTDGNGSVVRNVV
jgi:hypothetical protein